MINHIELAKEYCNHIHTDEASDENTFVEFTANQLAAYTNAVIEMCAKECDPYTSGQNFSKAIRALKVKG